MRFIVRRSTLRHWWPAFVLALAACATEDPDNVKDTDEGNDTGVSPPIDDGGPVDPTAGTYSDAFSLPGFLGDSVASVRAIVVDGAGDTIVAGSFAYIGQEPYDNVARWDGEAWLPMGDGLDGTVNALALDASGDILAAAYDFDTFTGYLYRWDGSDWSVLAETSGAVQSLKVEPDGDVIIGGSFFEVDGVSITGVARFDGVTWSPVGLIEGETKVYKLFDWDGEGLCAAGAFGGGGGIGPVSVSTTASEYAAVRCYDGEQWNGMGTVETDVYDVEQLSDGTWVAAGKMVVNTSETGLEFTTGLLQWDGEDWVPGPFRGVAGGLSTLVRDIVPTRDGGFLIGGQFAGAGVTMFDGDQPVGGIVATNIAEWDGSEWSALTTGGPSEVLGPVAGDMEGVFVIEDAGDGALWVGGVFSEVPAVGGYGSQSAPGLALFDGEDYQSVVDEGSYFGLLGQDARIERDNDGTLWVFNALQADGTASLAATWSGSGWTPVEGLYGTATAVERDVDGSLLVVGALQLENGTQGSVVRRQGDAWQIVVPLLGHTDAYVRGIVPTEDYLYLYGDFVTSTASYLARYSPQLGLQSMGFESIGPVQVAAIGPDDLLYAAGRFWDEESNLLSYDGTSWAAEPQISGGIHDLTAFGDQLVIAGSYMRGSVDGVPVVGVEEPATLITYDVTTYELGTIEGLRWTDQWNDRAGSAQLAEVHRGGLYVSGLFNQANGEPANFVAWYDGTTWHDLDGGLDDGILDLVVGPQEVWMTGYFRQAGEHASQGVARLELPEQD